MTKPGTGEQRAVDLLDFWPSEMRREREAEHRAEILALPKWTLFRAGWLTPSGHVQGPVYWRWGDGCGPTSRDVGLQDVLRRAAEDTCYTSQPWGIEVLAWPKEDGACVPEGACERFDPCAMHDSAFKWAFKKFWPLRRTPAVDRDEA